MKDIYYDIILTFSIAAYETREKFLQKLNNIDEVKIEKLSSSMYVIEAEELAKVFLDLEEIGQDLEFDNNDFVTLYCAATFTSENIAPAQRRKIRRVDIEINKPSII